jgi:uncharacterized protein
MPYCPHCGQQLLEGARYCDKCGEALLHLDKAVAQRSLLQHLAGAACFTASNPTVLVPEALAGALKLTMGWTIMLLGTLFDVESLYDYIYPQLSTVAYTIQDTPDIPPGFWLFGLSIILMLIAYTALSGVFTFTAVHMVWTGVKTGHVSLGGSARYVLGRFWGLILAVVLGNLLCLTVVLVPAVLFMYAAMVVDDTGIREGLSKGFTVTMKRLAASTAIVIIYLGLQLSFDLIPHVGEILFSVPATIITVAIINVYATTK